VLRDAGFVTREVPFEYSAFPGRYGTPIGGALAAAAVLGAGATGLASSGRWEAPAVLALGLVAAGTFARAMLGDAVVELPLLRARATNLVATRGGESPALWLVAHLDSKSQPVPSAARVAGVALLALGVLAAVGSAMLQLAGHAHRTGWWVALVLAATGAPAVMASVVGSRSDGAVDNASGVAAVLEAARRVRSDLPLGVLLPSAEELGLAGARAWAREWARTRRPGTALNCDGVDDNGGLTVMYSTGGTASLIDTLRRVAPGPLAVRRMPLGLLTDSVALADRGWAAVTVSRGSWATLARVHSRRDSLENLTGRGVDDAADLLARAVEALP
jgi:hypothetical protein